MAAAVPQHGRKTLTSVEVNETRWRRKRFSRHKSRRIVSQRCKAEFRHAVQGTNEWKGDAKAIADRDGRASFFLWPFRYGGDLARPSTRTIDTPALTSGMGR